MSDAPPKSTVSVEINGHTIEANPGELVIEAAERNGVHIPRFCYHNRMRPVGMCRMCLVEIDQGRGPALSPSCMIPVTEGMKVDTESEHGAAPPESLAFEDRRGVAVAHVDAGGRAQGPVFDPAERRWEALQDVLGPVEDDRSPGPRQPADQQRLEGRQARRFLVAIDHIGSVDLDRSPDGPRVVHEPIGVPAKGPSGDSEVVAVGRERDVGPAFVPLAGRDQANVGALLTQLAVALTPPRDHARVIDPHDPHDRQP